MSSRINVDNGSRLAVSFGFFEGTGGVAKGRDEGTFNVAVKADLPRGWKTPIDGTVAGQAVKVIAIARSQMVKGMVILTVQTSDGGNDLG